MRGLRIVIMLVLLTATCAAAEPAATEPAATQPKTAAAWQAVLAKLASPDFAERQAGQRDLSRATWRDYAVLKKLAADADDEEVKERLGVQVEALEDAMAVNPPLITLDLNNVTPGQAVAALGKATGLQLELFGGDSQPVTLHAVERPFGEVLLAIIKRGTVTSPRAGVLELDPRSAVPTVSSGPFVISLVDTAMTSALGARQMVQMPVLRFAVVSDPRVTLAHDPAMELTTLTDDHGDDLIMKGNANLRLLSALRGGVSPMVEKVIQPGEGRSIVAVEGVAHLPVQVRRQTVSVPDASKMAGSAYNLGDLKVSVSKFSVTGPRMDFAITVMAADPRSGVADTSPISMTCLDDQGATVWSTSLGPGSGASGQMGWHGNGALHVQFARATKVQIVDVPFSFKNLSVPVVGK